MKDLSNFSQYHPSWEGRDFTKEEYGSLLDDLSKKKSDEQLLTDGQTIQIIGNDALGTITRLWQKLKGLLGFDNQLDPVKVNYDLLKLLRYGETHHYLNDSQIRTLVQNLRASLSLDKNKSYEKITLVIDSILPIKDDLQAATLVDREIKSYYGLNQDHLHESFWPKFIHKYIAPVRQDAARLHYNQANIYLEEDNLPMAIQSLENALEINPNKPHWQLTLAKTLLKSSEHKSTSEALAICKKALTILQSISTDSNDELLKELNDVKSDVTLSCCALNIKQENYSEAFSYLNASDVETIRNHPIQFYELFLAKNPLLKATDFQQANFIFFVSEKSDELKKTIPLLEKAINKYHAAYSDTTPAFIDQQLIKANLSLSDCYLASKEIEQAKTPLDEAWKILKALRNPLNMTTFNRFYEVFKVQAESLLKAIDSKKDLQGAMTVALHLKDLSSNDPKQCASYCNIVAGLYAQAGDDRLSLLELEQAFNLAPSQELGARIRELARSLGNHAMEQNRYNEALNYFKKVQSLAPAEISTLRNLTNLSLHLSNWAEAELWADRLMTANPKDSETFLLASSIATKLNKKEQAIAYVKQALKINPSNSTAIIKLYELSGQIDTTNVAEAINAARIIAASNPSDWHVHLQLGGLYQALKEYEPALQHFENAKRLNPNSIEILSALGNLLLVRQEFTSALQEFNQAAALQKSTTPYQEQLMICHAMLADQNFASGRYNQSLFHYQQMLAIAPLKTPEIVQKLVSFGKQLEQKDPRLAVETYKLILPHLSEGMVHSAELVNIYQKLGAAEENTRSYQNAIHFFEKAYAVDPKSISTLKHLADCYTSTGDAQKANETWQALNALGYQTDESKAALGNLYLRQGNFEEALTLFKQQARASVGQALYHSQIHDCYIGLALKNERTQPTQAIQYYEESLSFASKEQKQATANKFLALGNAYMQMGQREFGLRCFSLGLANAQNMAELPQQYVGEAYQYLARAHVEKKHFSQASDNYQKALLFLPNHLDLIMESADFDYSQGNLEKAAVGYRKIANLQPNVPSYRQRVVNTELAIADKYFAKGVHDPERVRQSILDLIDKATSAQFPHAKKIQSALGAWQGESSSNNKELQSLAQKATTPHQIEIDGRRACELLESAYDGGWHHMQPTEMPAELTLAIRMVREQIGAMRAYYETIQQRTDELMETLQSSALGGSFSNWDPLPKNQDLTKATAIVEQAKKALVLIEKASAKTPLALTPLVQQEINTLRQLILPSGWMHLAIIHYNNVLELLPTTYGEHCNKLIDAYVKVGDNINAIVTFERLKKAFPSAPLKIDHQAYSQVATNPEQQTKVTNEQLCEGLLRGADQQNQQKNYSAAVSNYNQAIKVATPQQTQTIAMRLLTLGDLLIASPSKQEAFLAYESIIPHLKSLNFSQQKTIQILTALAYEAKRTEDYPKALGYFSQALALNPNDAKLNAEIGSLHLLENDSENALKHYQKAVEIEPQNIQYQQHLADIEISIADQFFARGATQSITQSLRNLIELVTVQAPYANDIKTALGATFKFFSPDNRELRNLGSSVKSADDVEKESLRALELIRKAYDGEKNHIQPNEMPSDLFSQLELFEGQLRLFQAAKRSIPDRFQKTFNDQNIIVNPLLQALANYEKANQRFPEVYRDHYNRQIDALVLQGEPLKALNLYEKLKREFSAGSLMLSPLAFQSVSDIYLRSKKYNEALEIINEGIKEHPNNIVLKKLKCQIYFTLGENSFATNHMKQALKYYTEATNCGVEANIECYINLARIYKMASKSEIDLEEGSTSHFLNAAFNLKKAADLAPKNAELKFQLGRLVYDSAQNVPFNIRSYLTEAVRLEPTNLPYLYALRSWIEVFEGYDMNTPEFHEIKKKYKELGGAPGDGHETYWTSYNPYNI